MRILINHHDDFRSFSPALQPLHLILALDLGLR